MCDSSPVACDLRLATCDLRLATRRFHEGELVGIIGESGSGKTSFLNVLAGRAEYGTVGGSLTFNGQPHKPLLAHHIGFVPQAYLIRRELTVYENLRFAADMRLDPSIDPERKVGMIETALHLLGLVQCRDFVCDPHLSGQHLSGGQMRRVGIGIELVCLPRVLLLDEPTSALDAVNTRLVVQALRALANQVAAVVRPGLYKTQA